MSIVFCLFARGISKPSSLSDGMVSTIAGNQLQVPVVSAEQEIFSIMGCGESFLPTFENLRFTAYQVRAGPKITQISFENYPFDFQCFFLSEMLPIYLEIGDGGLYG